MERAVGIIKITLAYPKEKAMGRPQIRMVLAGCLVAALIAGCATMGFGPTPVQEVEAVLAEFEAAAEGGDVEGLMAAFSDDWHNSSGWDKPMLRDTIESSVARGEKSAVDLAQCEIAVDGDAATAGPVVYDSPTTGRIMLRFTVEKEADGVWRFVYDEMIH